MYTKLVIIFILIFLDFHSCSVKPRLRRIPHSALNKEHKHVPQAREGDVQWPLQWEESEAGQGRVRRRDSELIPLDLEVFRREQIGQKPVWKDPHLHQDPQKRKHDQTEDED
ncbi:uncharacterized protein LOC124366568 [Homalodisca vitripennis]|uniref:uncharacterized protein LOC124366568 n=1 Tax=Homalodisca vitripennis TaxID=197043 RepID=UPI001EEC3E9D|nr:uncharacterized protein LOC124366568 [Homalodisca vitripennis]KAG8254114.1 hypothetical protein J6590_014991 [Homalodisca vitripennis]